MLPFDFYFLKKGLLSFDRFRSLIFSLLSTVQCIFILEVVVA